MNPAQTEDAIRLISAILMDAGWNEDELKGLPEEEGLAELCRTAAEIRAHAYALSRGDLSRGSAARGFVAGALKEAEANLRHLTWQMERVAEGDYSQSLSFMGDFSVAFNRMSREMRAKVHELTRLFERYRLFTHEDVLTGLLNCKTFFEMAVGELRRARETRSPLCFLMADVDEFRKVNDRYGHASGDSVLQLFACRLREALRPDDLCCRFGGDEFVVFMPRTGRAEGLEVAERIRQGCAQAPIPGAMTELSVTASFGLAAFREEAFDGDFDPVVLLEKAVQHSERLLRRAKDEGRNCVRA